MNETLKNDLLSLLVLMRRKAETASSKNPDFEPTVSTHRVIDLLRGSGLPFSYSLLSELRDDPDVGQYIADLNKDQLTISLGGSDDEAAPEEPEDGMDGLGDEPADLGGEMPADDGMGDMGMGQPDDGMGVDPLAAPVDPNAAAPAPAPAPSQPAVPAGQGTNVVMQMAKRAMNRR